MSIKVKITTGYGLVVPATIVQETARAGIEEKDLPNFKEVQLYFMERHHCCAFPFNDRECQGISFLISANDSVVKPDIKVFEDAYANVCTDQEFPMYESYWFNDLIGAMQDMGIDDPDGDGRIPKAEWHTIVTADCDCK